MYVGRLLEGSVVDAASGSWGYACHGRLSVGDAEDVESEDVGWYHHWLGGRDAEAAARHNRGAHVGAVGKVPDRGVSIIALFMGSVFLHFGSWNDYLEKHINQCCLSTPFTHCGPDR
jgi:hypothetical protein